MNICAGIKDKACINEGRVGLPGQLLHGRHQGWQYQGSRWSSYAVYQKLDKTTTKKQKNWKRTLITN